MKTSLTISRIAMHRHAGNLEMTVSRQVIITRMLGIQGRGTPSSTKMIASRNTANRKVAKAVPTVKVSIAEVAKVAATTAKVT